MNSSNQFDRACSFFLLAASMHCDRLCLCVDGISNMLACCSCYHSPSLYNRASTSALHLQQAEISCSKSVRLGWAPWRTEKRVAASGESEWPVPARLVPIAAGEQCCGSLFPSPLSRPLTARRAARERAQRVRVAMDSKHRRVLQFTCLASPPAAVIDRFEHALRPTHCDFTRRAHAGRMRSRRAQREMRRRGTHATACDCHAQSFPIDTR